MKEKINILIKDYIYSKKDNIINQSILFIFLTIILTKFINFTFLGAILFSALTILAIFITKYKNFFSYIIILVIIILNTFMLVLAIVPSTTNNIDLKQYYKNKQNYIKILKGDSNNKLKNTFSTLIIKKKDGTIQKYKLWTIPHKSKFIISQGDKIIFISKTKKLKTIVNLYLWDGSIIRIFPQTSINIDKILKNLQNLSKSQTSITVEQGNIWIRIIKTIIDNQGFNIKTEDGTLVIRGTAGLISKQPNETIVYSYDHILEAQNKIGKETLIPPKKSVKITKDNIEEIDINYIRNKLSNIFSNLNFIINLDQQDISNYKIELLNFIKNQINTIQTTNILYKLTELKNNFSNFIQTQNIDTNIKKIQIENIKLYTNNIQDLIFIPLTENIKKEKLEYIKNKIGKSYEFTKTYIIQKLNYILEKGNYNINFDKIQNLIKINNIDINTLKQYIPNF